MAATHDWASSSPDNNNVNTTHGAPLPGEVGHQDDPAGRMQSIPPWIITPDLRNGPSQLQSPQPPQSTFPPHHQYLPEKHGGRTGKGRRWDHLRSAEPAMLDRTLDQIAPVWRTFMNAGPQYHPSEVTNTTVMSDAWMDENVPFWKADPQLEKEHGPVEKHQSLFLNRTRRRGLFNRISRMILKNPFIPLVFRTVNVAFTLAALALAVRVYTQTSAQDHRTACDQRASTYIAIIVDSVAVPYILYITWDEYTSKPLGLRSATTRVALLLLDLYFIVFYSSTLSLAFQALTDTRWACFSNQDSTCTYSAKICKSERALAAVILISLVAWMGTFSISVLRVVRRLGHEEVE